MPIGYDVRMSLHEIAGVGASVLLGLIAILQALLAIGLPLGRFAWGGRHRVLPAKLRVSSALAIPILGFAGWMALARTGILPPGGEPLFVRVIAWVFAGYFALNVAMNVTSKSRSERLLMTPITVLLVACFVVASLS